MKNSEPAIKPQYASTFHQDGTVSHWGVYSQCWRRMPASQIGDMELAAMPKEESERIVKMAEVSK